MSKVEFRCCLAEKGTPLAHFWEHTVGSGHATLALRADWQAQLRRCHAELGFNHVRFHGILSDDMGTLVDERDQMVHAFFNADQIFDFLLSIGMKPFVELSFMPRALSSGDTTVFSYAANVTPPKDYKLWATFINKLVTHWVERYGVTELRSWFFEVWNEPNLKAFWPAAQADYFKLYRYTAQAIKEIDDQLKVGGPATAKDEWIEAFLDFCERSRLPVDFVSTHHYPTDALGTEDEDTLTQLAGSRRGIMRDWAQDTQRRARGKPVYYTEWNASSNPRDPLHDEPYTAAVVVKTMLEAAGLVAGYGFWTFTDIFAENYFPAQPFQGGFGLLTMRGVAKPSYRAFELLHCLGAEQLHVDGLDATVDAWIVRGQSGVTVLATNHALPRHPIDTENVHVRLDRAPRPRRVTIERIDDEHANPKRLWGEMGAPQYPSARDMDHLAEASRLVKEPLPFTATAGAVEFDFTMPPHAVAAITLELAPGTALGADQ